LTLNETDNIFGDEGRGLGVWGGGKSGSEREGTNGVAGGSRRRETKKGMLNKEILTKGTMGVKRTHHVWDTGTIGKKRVGNASGRGLREYLKPSLTQKRWGGFG